MTGCQSEDVRFQGSGSFEGVDIGGGGCRAQEGFTLHPGESAACSLRSEDSQVLLLLFFFIGSF